MILIKLDVSKVDKSKLFKGKPGKDGKCPMWLDLVLIETKQSNFGDWRDDQTHIVKQSQTKEERDRGEQGVIIGNASQKTRPKQKEAVAEPTTESDDVPF